MSKNLVRLSQLVTSFGPGAMLDLPDRSVMIAGLDHWEESKRRPIVEPRLARKLPDGFARGLATPPVHEESPYRKDAPGVDAILFPEWFVATSGEESEDGRIRLRLVRFHELDRKSGKLVEGSGRNASRTSVVPVRFVAACERGHVQDVDWRLFAHRGSTDCVGRLWLEEGGVAGDAAEARVVCECGAGRPLYEALAPDTKALGRCHGRRPWLGPGAGEECDRYLRLLVRTASNAYFPVTLAVLGLPTDTEASRLDQLVAEHAEALAEVRSREDLQTAFRFNPALRNALASHPPEDVLAALERLRAGSSTSGKRLKPEEIEILATPPPVAAADPKAPLVTEVLDRDRWDPHRRFPVVAQLSLVHRLRVVTALRGFTRFDFVTPDKDGELDPELRVQELSLDARPYPAIEQHGEGLFVQFDRAQVETWLAREVVKEREASLRGGYERWARERGREPKHFPGAAWIALHTLSHLLLAEIALEAGYPLASLKERVYAVDGVGYGILLYAAASDVGGTLGGVVALGERVGALLERAVERARICANDPVCSEHDPATNRSGHPLAGAACHGCVLLPEPCCEMRNDFLDRALACGTLGHRETGLLGSAVG